MSKETEEKAKQEALEKAAADLKPKQEADAKAAIELKAKQEADAAAELKAQQEAKVVELPQKSAKERYEELPYSATVVYECDGPDTKTQEGESEITSRKLTPSCTKGHWEGMPRWDKGIRKGQRMHLNNARLIGFIENGELVKV